MIAGGSGEREIHQKYLPTIKVLQANLSFNQLSEVFRARGKIGSKFNFEFII